MVTKTWGKTGSDSESGYPVLLGSKRSRVDSRTNQSTMLVEVDDLIGSQKAR
jgi:hypothetical protein